MTRSNLYQNLLLNIKKCITQLYVNAIIPFRKKGINGGNISPFEGVLHIPELSITGVLVKPILMSGDCTLACTDGLWRKLNASNYKTLIWRKGGWREW